jgi:hypothetical protein
MKKYARVSVAMAAIVRIASSAIPAQAVGGPTLPSDQNLIEQFTIKQSRKEFPIMKKSFALAAVLVTAAGLMTAGAVPAQANGGPVLPSNQRVYTSDCNGDFGGNLWSVDPTNGDSTLVGDTSVDQCTGGGSENPLDGKAYIVYYGATTYLATADTTNGGFTKVADINGATTDGWTVAITNAGEGFLMNGDSLYTIDLETATTVLVANFPFNDMQAIAYNPVDDTLYGFKRPTGEVYTIDRTTGVPTLDATHSIVIPPDFTTCAEGGNVAYELDLAVFDANGNLWIQGDACEDGELLAVDFATGVVSWKGQWTDTAGSLFPAGDTFYAESVFIITVEDAPALPDTGANASAMSATTAISFGLLSAGAITLVLMRRRLSTK